MSLGTVVVGLAVAALLAAVIVNLVRSRRAGRSTCAAGCGDCAAAPACAREPATCGPAAGAPGPVKLALRLEPGAARGPGPAVAAPSAANPDPAAPFPHS
jgi:hypothetical protein